MQGRPKTRKNNFLKRPDQRSLDRRERRKKQRAMSLQQTISEEDNRAIADLQAKYGSGPFLAADAVVQSRDGQPKPIPTRDQVRNGLLALTAWHHHFPQILAPPDPLRNDDFDFMPPLEAQLSGSPRPLASTVKHIRRSANLISRASAARPQRNRSELVFGI